MKRVLYCAIALLFGNAIYNPGAWGQQECVFPSVSWEVRSPAQLGVSEKKLDELASLLGGRGCVIRDGYVAKSWGDQSQVSDWFSSAKPVLSTLLFFAIEEGLAQGVDQPIADFGWELSEKDRSMTFRHLGSMTSGYARPERPGEAWAYNDFAIQLYQRTLFDRVFKADAKLAAEQPYRLGALGFEDGLKFNEKRRIYASVRDFSRIVWFWMNKGKWHDRQLLPGKYFDLYMQPQTPRDLPLTIQADTNDYLGIMSFGGGSDHFTKAGAGIYGFNWWFNNVGGSHPTTLTWPDAPTDTVMSIGARGNNAAFIPSLGMALVCADGSWSDLKAGDANSKINLALKLLKEAAADALSDSETTPPSPAPGTEELVGPWNLTELKKPPAMRWLDQTGAVHSLVYSGEKYLERDTEVFAFYASPLTLGEAQPGSHFPGVVLIHGGGGTAFAEWAWLWAKRGYAAIAMDLSGSRPPDPVYDAGGIPVPSQAAKPDSRTRLPEGGPNQGHPEKFDSIGGDVSDDWPFHAAANAIRAHSLLRSFPDVLADRTAVTGISWGGYTTCLVASLDDRFQAAVPVYGCGFLHEGESVQKPSIDGLGERRDAWVEAYDPSSLLPGCRVPILFVNGTNDVHYPLDSYQKSFDLVPGIKQLRIEVNMRHGHVAGWQPQEIGLFIDSFCRDGKALPVPGDIVVEGDRVEMPFRSSLPVNSAELHYSTDVGPRSQRAWKTLPAVVGEGLVTATTPPDDANTWFMALTDQRGAMVTSSVQFKPVTNNPPTNIGLGHE